MVCHNFECEAPRSPMGDLLDGKGAAGPGTEGCARKLGGELRALIEGQCLRAQFQPIVDLATDSVYGFEGLIRGPSNTVLHSPLNLFRVARLTGQLFELEVACLREVVESFAAARLPQCLFVNVNPSSLARAARTPMVGLERLRQLGLGPERVVIELTESQPTFDYGALLEAARHFRGLGFRIALDDLGEGFSSLRLWSELRPEFVKLDKHFVQGVAQDPVKHQFLRSLRDIAARTGARVVAEGLETEADLGLVRDLGLEFGQGYLLGRPSAVPVPALTRLRPPEQAPRQGRRTAGHLLIEVAPEAPEAPNLQIAERFTADPGLQSIPVVRGGAPVGLLNRHAFMDLMARPFSRELFGKKGCETQMDRNLLVVDQGTGLQELSRLIVESDPRHILHGFIITREGRYLGMGSGHDLMREITRLQIDAARHANPLTLLPGNVPINELLDELIRKQLPFVVCHCDLDHFKPYNDVHGYRRGDEVLQWLGRLLEEAVECPTDFIGHVGGDDFIAVFQGRDWEERCRHLLERFDRERARFFTGEELARGGYEAEDRRGQACFHPLLGLSIGAVRVEPGAFLSHHEISAAAALAKKEAKRVEGSALFIERRQRTPPSA